MKANGTLERAHAISFDELRDLLGAGPASQSTTALPDETCVSIRAVRPDAEIFILCSVPTEYADSFGGSGALTWVIEGKTTEAFEAARAFLFRACKAAGIAVR